MLNPPANLEQGEGDRSQLGFHFGLYRMFGCQGPIFIVETKIRSKFDQTYVPAALSGVPFGGESGSLLFGSARGIPSQRAASFKLLTSDATTEQGATSH